MKFLEIFKNPLGKYAIGRIAFAIFFVIFVPVYFYRWIRFGENEIHYSVLTLFGTLLGYNFSKKIFQGRDGYQNRIKELLNYKDPKSDY